jgi:hypothetical protein
MTFPLRGDVAAFALAALVVIALTILAALHATIPDVLTTIALVASGAGAGATVPRAAAPTTLTGVTS